MQSTQYLILITLMESFQANIILCIIFTCNRILEEVMFFIRIMYIIIKLTVDLFRYAQVENSFFFTISE